MNSQQNQPLTVPCQRKSGIVSINGFPGVDAICLYALNNLDPAIEHREMLELGNFMNHYVSEARTLRAERGCDPSDNFAVHDDAPIEWLLGNFAWFVRDHKINSSELKMMIDVAIGVRAIAT